MKIENVIPSASYDNQTLLTAHRNVDIGDFYYIYNYGGTDNYQEISDSQNVQTEVTLTGEGTPYFADAWTGQITPITDYKKGNGTITVNVNIAANDSNIIILSNKDFGLKSINDTDGNFDDIKVTDWNLTVESWTKGDTVLATKKTKIDIGKLDRLVTWDQIKGLENVSGIGEYRATFEIDDNYKLGQKAYIHVGKIKDAFKVTINGKDIVTNQVSGIAEISEFLAEGKNEIKITVATSMLNAVLYS